MLNQTEGNNSATGRPDLSASQGCRSTFPHGGAVFQVTPLSLQTGLLSFKASAVSIQTVNVETTWKSGHNVYKFFNIQKKRENCLSPDVYTVHIGKIQSEETKKSTQ